MGYVMVFGPCIICHRPFSFNPHKVPSFLYEGVREPICKVCMDALIEKERAEGKEPKLYHPEAYEAIPEEEL